MSQYKKEVKSFKKLLNDINLKFKSYDIDKKECDRLNHIYVDVYRHARKKNQSHKAALDYCFKVYERQVSKKLKNIVLTIQTGKSMKSKNENLRHIIRSLISEGDVVDLSKFRPEATEVIESEDEITALIKDFYENLSIIDIPKDHKFEDLVTTIKAAMDDYFEFDDNEFDDDDDISDSDRRFLDFMNMNPGDDLD